MTAVEHRPGSRLRRFAERTFERQTLERVIFPALADLEYECGGRARASGLVRLRAYWGVWKAVAVCLLTDWGRHGRPLVAGVAMRMTIVFPIVMGLVMVPALNAAFGRPPVLTHLLLYLPQAVVPALPVAFFFAVALEQHPGSLRRLVPVVFVMSLVCTLAMMVVTLSVVPRANHAYAASLNEHLTALGRPTKVSPGSDEWTFTELVRKARGEASERDRMTASQVLAGRLATSTLPFALGFVALGLAGYERTHALGNGIWLLMFYIAALRAAGSSSFVGPSARGVWLVNAVFVLGGLCLVWLRPKRVDSDLEPKGYVIS